MAATDRDTEPHRDAQPPGSAGVSLSQDRAPTQYPPEREPNGRWKKGSAGGGHGFAPRKVRLTTALHEVITTDAARALVQAILVRALSGDMQAAKLLWDRLEGPVPLRVAISYEERVSRVMMLAGVSREDAERAVREAERLIEGHAARDEGPS